MKHSSDLVSLTASLDGIRGLLAVWVFLSHISQFVDGPGGLIARGGIAVDLFMMVSGFLMVWTVLSRQEREPLNVCSTWRKFYIRRFFRIAPLYYLCLVVAYAWDNEFSTALKDIYTQIGSPFNRPFRECRPPLPIDVVLHLTFLFGLFPCSSSSNVLPDWSLSLEMQFYVLFPILLFAIRSRFGFAFVLIGVALAGISQSLTSVYIIDTQQLISYPQPSILPMRLNCFLVGMIFGSIVHGRRLTFGGLALIIIAGFLFQRLTFAAIFIFVFATYMAKLDRHGNIPSIIRTPLNFFDYLLSLSVPRFLGDISFGIYLIHLLVLIPAVATLNDYHWFVSSSGQVKFLVICLVLGPLVVTLSWVAHRLVEVPMISLGRRLTHSS